MEPPELNWTTWQLILPAQNHALRCELDLTENKREQRNVIHDGNSGSQPWLHIRIAWELLKMQIPRLHTRPIKSGFGGDGVQH